MTSLTSVIEAQSYLAAADLTKEQYRKLSGAMEGLIGEFGARR